MREGKRETKITEHLLCSLVMVTKLKNSVFQIHVSSKGCVTSLVLKCFFSPHLHSFFLHLFLTKTSFTIEGFLFHGIWVLLDSFISFHRRRTWRYLWMETTWSVDFWANTNTFDFSHQETLVALLVISSPSRVEAQHYKLEALIFWSQVLETRSVRAGGRAEKGKRDFFQVWNKPVPTSSPHMSNSFPF